MGGCWGGCAGGCWGGCWGGCEGGSSRYYQVVSAAVGAIMRDSIQHAVAALEQAARFECADAEVLRETRLALLLQAGSWVEQAARAVESPQTILAIPSLAGIASGAKSAQD